MHILLIDNGTSYLQALADLCGAFGRVTIKGFGQISSHSQPDLLVLSGGHSYPVLRHPVQYHSEVSLIKSFKGPMIGVCLGYELIVHTYGGKLAELADREKGLRDVTVVANDPIFDDQTRFRVYESHRWTVRSAPGFTTLATSLDGIEIIRHQTKPIYGFQFHPEEVGAVLFTRAIQTLTTDSHTLV